MQGYTAIVIEPVGSSNQGQVKAMLMGSAVNQDGRSGGLTVGCKPKQSTMPMQHELLPPSHSCLSQDVVELCDISTLKG